MLISQAPAAIQSLAYSMGAAAKLRIQLSHPIPTTAACLTKADGAMPKAHKLLHLPGIALHMPCTMTSSQNKL